MIERKGSLYQLRKALDKWRNTGFTEVQQTYLRDAKELEEVVQKHELVVRAVESRVIQ